MDILTKLTSLIRKIPVTFLVVILTVLGLILFLPEECARFFEVDEFRNDYNVFLGLTFLLTVSFSIARIFLFFIQWCSKRNALKIKQELLRKLTPEEKGYLIPYIKEQKISVYARLEDGVMSSLEKKNITYRATKIGNGLNGFAFNLQSWARKYLEEDSNLLDGHVGQPMC